MINLLAVLISIIISLAIHLKLNFMINQSLRQQCFYLFTDTGKVYKLFSKGEETYVSSTYSPTKNSEVIWSMQQYVSIV